MLNNEPAGNATPPRCPAKTTLPLVAISILNWNGWQDTLGCLESVKRLNYPNFLTVVVDNGSWNGSVERIRSWAQQNLGVGHVLAEYTCESALKGGDKQVEKALDAAASGARMVLICSHENLGFPGGNNVAIQYALRRSLSADYVFLLNNDAKPAHSCLRELVSVDQHSQAGMVGATILAEQGGGVLFGGRAPMLRQFFSPLVKWHLPAPKLHGDYWESFFISGTAILIRSDVLRAICNTLGEYLRAELFLYSEEIMLSSDVRKAGYRSVVAAKAHVWHKKAASSGGARNPIVYYYPERNQILTAKELLPLHWRIPFHFISSIRHSGQILKALAHGRYGTSRAVVLGVVDGYRGVTGKWKYHDEEVRRYVHG